MTKTPYIRLRGTVWTWRRRLPQLSTKIEHLQLSLGTQSLPVARILANRLNYEFDKVTAAMRDGLTYEQGKTLLTKALQDEIRTINYRRLETRMDTAPGNGSRAVREDWATAHAWGLISRDGIDARITHKIAKDLQAANYLASDIDLLADTLYAFADDLRTEAAATQMIRKAREILSGPQDVAQGSEKSFSKTSMHQLMKILISAKAIAWGKVEGTMHVSEEQVLDGLCLVDADSGQSQRPQIPATHDVAAAQPLKNDAVAKERFKTDPSLTALAGRVNAEKNRKDIAEDTQKQFVATANLLVKTTGVTSICDLEQRHMKYFMNVLDGIPKSYGKSSADSARTIEEIISRGETLPAEKVGLAPRTQNGHLDRISLMMRLAKAEGLRVHDVDFGLLRVPETERARDKRSAFTLEQARKLFTHPIWTGCIHGTRRHIPGRKIIKDSQFFGALLGAYTGARREELLGLAPEDIYEIDGIPCIHIRVNHNRGIKTPGSARVIPIHDHLLELGLLDHVAAMQKRKQTALFPELIPKTSNQKFGDAHYYNWRKALNLQLEGADDELCFHSWRHYVISTLKEETSVTDKQRRDLAGHVGEDVHDEVYDRATKPEVMKRVVNLLPRMF